MPTPVQGSVVQRVPFDAENEQREHEHIAQMRELHAQGWGQNRIIEHLFGGKRGGARRYQEARALYREAIMLSEGASDEDEAEL